MTAAFSRVLIRATAGAVLAAGLLATSAPPASAATTANLLKNPNAEVAPTGTTGNDVDVPFWDDRAGATTAKYGGQRFFPNNATPGPAARGSAFFYGGPGGDSESVQTFDISPYVPKINTGVVKINVVAWLGGILDDSDRCDFEVRLVDGTDTNTLKTVKLTGPTAAERGNQTKLVKRAKTVLVPKATRLIGVSIVCDQISGSPNNGLADNIVVKFLNV